MFNVAAVTEMLFLCDMRPGFTEDGLECVLPPGSYAVSSGDVTQSGARGFHLMLEDCSPDGRRNIGELNVDMARIGILDRNAFLRHFEDDHESLFDWSGDALDMAASDAAIITLDKNTKLSALVINVGCDGVYAVESLHSGDNVVGLAVTPLTAAAEPSGVHCFTRVDVKFSGIGELWQYVDDWAFEPDLVDVLDSLVEETAVYAEFLRGNRIDAKDIDPAAGLRRYLPRFRGVKQISAYLEEADARTRRIKLPAPIESVRPTESASFNEIGNLVYAVIGYARTQHASVS